MHLSQLIEGLAAKPLGAADHDPHIASLCFDSRRVVAGSLFVAVAGSRVDGHDYIVQAIQQGAAAVVAERFDGVQAQTGSARLLQVDNSAAALGRLAARWYGNPSQKMQLIAVTGTNGKTTVVSLLHQLFTHLGYKAGLISTVGIRVGNQERPATHTTPDALTIQATLADMAQAGVSHVFMEASSHALVQHRTTGIDFRGAVFTNMSHDHLDYHQTFKAYIEAKKLLFDRLSRVAFSLVNIDDKRGEVMVQNTPSDVYRYSLRAIADFRARVIEDGPQGLHLEIDGRELYTRLIGRFNAYNLLAVYGVARLLGEDQLEVLTALSSLQAPAGRLQYIQPDPNGPTAVVDYAHTPDALAKALQTLRQTMPASARLYCVVGAGGDRDAAKRPEMARIAAREADQLILTSDNPRSEDPEVILDQMEAGLDTEQLRARSLRLVDRRAAIHMALDLAQPQDLILIAGKGHETYQEIQGIRHPFDDREVVRDFFSTHSSSNLR